MANFTPVMGLVDELCVIRRRNLSLTTLFRYEELISDKCHTINLITDVSGHCSVMQTGGAFGLRW